MKNSILKKLILVMCLLLSVAVFVCSCNNSNNDTTNDDTPGTEDTDDKKPGGDNTGDDNPTTVTYKVTVTDENNAPLAGASVQLCVGDLCMLPVPTGADGVATVEAAKGECTVKVTLAGYTGEASYSFADGSTELTVKLTKDTANAI